MRQTQELQGLRRRVERWRREGGGRGSRIPEELWNEAVEISRTAGLYATARALRFNYHGLKKRAKSASQRERKPRAAFVSLPLPTSGEIRVAVAIASRVGAQMRIDIAGARAADLVALAQAFWGKRSCSS